MHTSPTLAALERLVAARGVRDVAEAIGDWRDLGLCDAVAVWWRDPTRDLLSLAQTRGIDPTLAQWRPGPRAAGGPLWRAIQRAEPVAVELPAVPVALAVPLRLAEIDRWVVYPLRGPGGEEHGAALVGGGRDADELPIAAAGAAVDRAAAADAARWSASWLRAVADMVADGVIVATPDGDLLEYNRALFDLSGWSLEQIRAHGWTHLVYPDPEVRSEVQRGIAALLHGHRSEGIVRPIATASGAAKQVRIWSALVPRPGGGSPAMVGVFHDVTQEQLAAREQRRDESLSRLGRMAGGVAHEFNNLLGAVMGHAELIESDPATTPTIARRATTIAAACQRGAHLSKQLLAFSGATFSHPTPLRLDPLVRELAELFRPTLRPGAALELALDDVPPVEADESHLQQALTNLLANARDAARRVVRVEVSRAPLPPAPRYRSPGCPPTDTWMGRIRVSDDGAGFTDEALRHLFEPFFTDKVRGHGLGLAAVRGIVGLHDGALDVHPSGPTHVDLYLPLSQRPELKLSHSRPARGSAGTGRVWLIDDETALLEFTRISLEAAGYEVRAFASGAAALAALRAAGADSPDAVVVDVVMPEMDGPSVVRALRGAGWRGQLLWTSGYSPDSAEVPHEAAAFLQKPFTGSELVRAVADTLDSRSPAEDQG